MADEADDTLDLDEYIVPDEDEGAEDEAPEADEQDDGEEESFAIELDGEQEDQEPPLVKTLRQEIRERDKELATYRRASAPEKVEVGPKPKLDDPDVDYDDDKLTAKIESWVARKNQAEAQEREAEQAARARQEADNKRTAAYYAKLAAIPLPEEEKQAAHSTVETALNHTLQAAIVHYAKNPANVVIALAKHPQKLNQMAQMSDPIEFILAMREMEGNLKVVNRKKPPAPEADSIQRGSAPASASMDKKLDQMEKEAARTGDRTKLVAYKAELNKKRAAA